MMTLILFDFDGVLADTLDDMLTFAQAACAQMGLPRDPTPADLDALETMSFVEFGRQLNLPPERVNEFVNLCLEMFHKRPQPPRIFAGMAQVVEQAASHHRLAIVTGNTSQTVERFLIENRLQNHIEMVIGVDYPGTKVEKIRLVLTKLQQPEEIAYMVGDAVSDIQAARQAGIKSLAAGWGHQSISRLMGARPDYLVESPRELQNLLHEL